MGSRLRIGLGAGAALAVSLALWCARTPPIAVETTLARRAPLVVEVSTNGKVEPIEKSEIRVRLDGRVVAIPDPGERIAEGEVLLSIDPGTAASELADAQSERLAVEEELRRARDHLARARSRAAADQELYRQGALTRERYDLGQAELRDARSKLEHLLRDAPLRGDSLDLRIRELEARRDAAEIRAPYAGTVYKSDARRGQMVEAGDLVLWFADLDRLRVRANVDQVDLGRVAVGQSVRVTSNAHPGRVWSAQMSDLIPNVSRKESRLVAEGLARVEPPTDGLLPGMTVDVEILVEQVAGALQLPAEAIFTDAQGSYVFELEDGTVRQTRVRVGRSTVDAVEIAEGLEAGDRVVLGPASGLADGARVVARVADNGSS